MGFGHRVYKSYDPRAKLIKKVADSVFEQTGLNPKLEIALELERIALEDEYFVSRKLYPNVDFYSGLIYQAMGYPTDYFTVLFALGRLPGLDRAVGGDAQRPRAEDRAAAPDLHRRGRASVRADRRALGLSYAAAPMAEVVSTNQFRNGMHIELDGQTWRIVDFQHVKPGKGGAFVRTKLKSLGSGSVVDRTFRAGEKFNRIRTETKSMQYLYDSGDEVVFMDEETFDQLSLPHGELEDELPFMQPSSSVQVLFVDGSPSGVDLPASVVLEVTETEPGVKGDTVSNVTKPATLETGAVVQVPLFVNVGDRIKVDPREKRYIQRSS